MTEASLIKNQMHEAGMDDVLFTGISGIYSEDFLKIGAEAAEGALAIKPVLIPLSLLKDKNSWMTMQPAVIPSRLVLSLLMLMKPR